MIRITLSDAAEADIPTIMAITQAAFAEYAGLLDPPSSVPNETPALVRAKLAEGQAVLAYLGEQAIGSVYYSPKDSYVYLGRLAVLPAHRGHGVGALLVAEVERRARALGLPAVQLGARVALPQLRRFYERLGYRVIAEQSHPGYTIATFLVMEKHL